MDMTGSGVIIFRDIMEIKDIFARPKAHPTHVLFRLNLYPMGFWHEAYKKCICNQSTLSDRRQRWCSHDCERMDFVFFHGDL